MELNVFDIADGKVFPEIGKGGKKIEGAYLILTFF